MTINSNAINFPHFVFTLRVKKIVFPMRVEVGPYPLPAPVPISPDNGAYEGVWGPFVVGGTFNVRAP